MLRHLRNELAPKRAGVNLANTKGSDGEPVWVEFARPVLKKGETGYA